MLNCWAQTHLWEQAWRLGTGASDKTFGRVHCSRTPPGSGWRVNHDADARRVPTRTDSRVQTGSAHAISTVWSWVNALLRMTGTIFPSTLARSVRSYQLVAWAEPAADNWAR